MSCAIIACLKQEELYIKEWLDWHISIGIDKFYLCDNNDEDYLPKLQDIIKDYINKGIVEIFNYSGVHPIQPICYTEIYDIIGYNYDWVLIIDIDEFIWLPKYNNQLKDYLKNVPEYIKCIGINWRNYGDNELIEYDDRPVQERFKNPINISHNNHPFIINGQSNVIKSIIRGKKYFNYDIKIKHQHYAIPKEIKKYKIYDVLFNKISKSTYNSISKNENLIVNSKYFQEIYNTFYIKHYGTKTIEEYIWKINRGDTLKDKNDKKYPYKISNFWGKNNKTKEKIQYLKNHG